MQFDVKLNALLIILAVNDFVPEQIRVIRRVCYFGFGPENDLGFSGVLGPSVAL